VAIEPFSLGGRYVELVPLEVTYATELAEAAVGDRSTYDFTDVPESPEAMRTYISRLLAARDRGEAVPFAQRRLADGRLVGCTRYLELRHWRGRPQPDEVEIGGTWLAADAQRTPINTEAKLLLLTHAFETWGAWRVALCTDARNRRSWEAIERIGARHEGVLRNHRASHMRTEAGRPRDSALFSITETDWPEVRERLTGMLTRA
jgi:RimJ/RimL family protein N-acetyltransferase